MDFSLLTAPGAAVVILSQLVAQELAQLAFSELTAPGAAVVISISQLVAQELAQLDFSELTAPGAASPTGRPPDGSPSLRASLAPLNVRRRMRLGRHCLAPPLVVQPFVIEYLIYFF